MRYIGAVFFALVVGCGGDSGSDAAVDGNTDASADASIDGDVDGSTDGSTDAAVDAPPAVDGVTPPAAPAPPVLTPCPAGFREVDDDGDIPYCDPWPATGYDGDCPLGEAHFPGEPGCAPVGSDCSADGWPAGLPAGASVVYVAASGARGDGTRARPYAGLSQLPFSLPAGTLVALGAGTFTGIIYAQADLEVRGVCPAQTEVIASAGMPAAFLTNGATLTVRDLRINGPASASGIDSIGEGTLDVAGVVIEGTMSGLYLEVGSTLTAERLVIRDLVPGNRWGMQLGGPANLRRVLIERAYNDGIQPRGATANVTLDRVAVLDTAIFGKGWGNGMTALQGAQVTVTASVFEENRSSAVVSDGAGTNVHLSDSVIRRTRRRPDGYFGVALQVNRTGTLISERVLADDNDGDGITVNPGGGTHVARDVLVRGGHGAAAPQPEEEWGRYGRGIDIVGDTQVTVERGAFIDNSEAGIVVQMGAFLEATDLIVRDTRPTAVGAFGRGIVIQEGGLARITRALVENNVEVGVAVGEAGSSLQADDLRIVRTLSSPLSGVGRGINAQGASSLIGQRIAVQESFELGLSAALGSIVTLGDFSIRDTRQRDCDGPCTEGPGGYSVASFASARVLLERFSVRDGDICGLFVALGGEMDVSDGVVADHTIGACVQVDGYDLDRLTDMVTYTGHESNLSATSLPVPEAL